MKAFLLLRVVTVVVMISLVGAQPAESRLRFVGFQLVLPWRLVYYESCPIGLPYITQVTVTATPSDVSILSCDELTVTQYTEALQYMTTVCGVAPTVTSLCTCHMCTVQDYNPEWVLKIEYPTANTCDVNLDRIAFTYNSTTPLMCCP